VSKKYGTKEQAYSLREILLKLSQILKILFILSKKTVLHGLSKILPQKPGLRGKKRDGSLKGH
jgi:hypothetical protein